MGLPYGSSSRGQPRYNGRMHRELHQDGPKCPVVVFQVPWRVYFEWTGNQGACTAGKRRARLGLLPKPRFAHRTLVARARPNAMLGCSGAASGASDCSRFGRVLPFWPKDACQAGTILRCTSTPFNKVAFGNHFTMDLLGVLIVAFGVGKPDVNNFDKVLRMFRYESTT